MKTQIRLFVLLLPGLVALATNLNVAGQVFSQSDVA